MFAVPTRAMHNMWERSSAFFVKNIFLTDKRAGSSTQELPNSIFDQLCRLQLPLACKIPSLAHGIMYLAYNGRCQVFSSGCGVRHRAQPL